MEKWYVKTFSSKSSWLEVREPMGICLCVVKASTSTSQTSVSFSVTKGQVYKSNHASGGGSGEPQQENRKLFFIGAQKPRLNASFSFSLSVYSK